MFSVYESFYQTVKWPAKKSRNYYKIEFGLKFKFL